jgi:DNA-binding NarL/FixJ family response regulator
MPTPATTPTTRVLVADPNPTVRACLRAFIETEPDLEFAGDASDEGWLLWALQVERPDVVLLDVALAGKATLQVLPEVRERCPEARIVMMSARPWDEPQALGAGAHGFVSKGQPPERVRQALRPGCQRLAA